MFTKCQVFVKQFMKELFLQERSVYASLTNRVYWEKDDIEALRKFGKDFIDGGSMGVTRVNKILDGSHLLSKYTISQIRTRVNHERNLKK